MGRSHVYRIIIICALSAWTVLAREEHESHTHADEASGLPDAVDTYFRVPTASSILYGHVGLMLLAWVGCYPIFLTLDVARSSYAYPAQILFLILNAIGTVFGLAYKSKTPDLYPGSIHGTISWLMTAVAVAQLLPRLLRSYLDHKTPGFDPALLQREAQSLMYAPVPEQYVDDDAWEGETAGSHRSTSPPTSEAGRNTSRLPHIYRIVREALRFEPTKHFTETSSWMSGENRITWKMTLARSMEQLSTTFSMMLVLLTFVDICSGLVTMSGIFVSHPARISIRTELTSRSTASRSSMA
jgi:hypothetical protein